MPFSIAGRVASLIEDVTRVELESEGSYLALGRLFPSIGSEMERSSRNGAASLAEFSSITGGTSESSLASMEAFAKESSAYFASIHANDAAFLERINESIDRLSSLEDVIGRVRSDSEEMEIISLNAMTVALKSGTAGKAFSVITDELKRLSSRTIALTETITGRGRSLMECFSGLRDSLGELDRFQDDFFGGLDSALTHGFTELESSIRDAMGLFGGLLEEARTVREPVQAIMLGIQNQDIIRQSLQHVTISLKEAEKAAADVEGSAEEGSELKGIDRDEELAFVAAIAELAATLLDDVVGKLEASSRDFEAHIGTVSSIVGGVEEKRIEFVRGLSGQVPSTRADAAGFSKGSATYLSLKKQVIQTARKLSDQVKGLDESFKGLAGLLSRFQNIVIASRIEVAKNRSLSGVANTVQGMVELTERIGTDVGEAMATTKDFIKVAYAAIVEYAGSGESRRESRAFLSSSGGRKGLGDLGLLEMERDAHDADNDRLLSTLARVESDIQLLDNSQGRVGEAIGNFVLYTAEFIDLIAQARSQLAVLAYFASSLKKIQGELSALREELALTVGPNLSLASIKSERLRTMIDRFTIFTHKKTAGEIGRFEVEEGVQAGEVTLF